MVSPSPIRSPQRQADLFAPQDDLPAGFRRQPDLVSAEAAAGLADELALLPFERFDFHGYKANRRVIAFGFRYDYGRREVLPATPIPAFLLPLRRQVAQFAGRPPEAFVQVLINEYPPGAAIGWHRDKPHFQDVVAVSLGAPATLRFRRPAGPGWERRALTVEPRSVYLLSGPARAEWEHSIAPVADHRYSITMRTLADNSV
jgi:alkylated DNA repair dioxygenase AlkB